MSGAEILPLITAGGGLAGGMASLNNSSRSQQSQLPTVPMGGNPLSGLDTGGQRLPSMSSNFAITPSPQLSMPSVSSGIGGGSNDLLAILNKYAQGGN